MSDEPLANADLHEAQRESLGQVLLRAARLLDERALEMVRAMPGSPDVRPAHTRLFPLIRFDGVRATELAERLGVTKQAITPLVQDLVNWGILEQVPDPRDGRARLVRWTDDGRRWMLRGLGVLGEVEAPWRDRVGHGTARTVHEALLELVDLLENDAREGTG